MKNIKRMSIFRRSQIAIGMSCAISMCSSINAEQAIVGENQQAELQKRYIVTLDEKRVSQAISAQKTLSPQTARHQLFQSAAASVNTDIILKMDSINSMVILCMINRNNVMFRFA